jgi:hypothetical protein
MLAFGFLIAAMTVLAGISSYMPPQGKWKHIFFGLQLVVILATICVYLSDTKTTNFLKAMTIGHAGGGL